MTYGERDPHHAYLDRQTARTYSQDELDAAVATERERCNALARQALDEASEGNWAQAAVLLQRLSDGPNA